MADCFCGCGRRIGRFPLGTRSVNDRGKIVAERLAWAMALGKATGKGEPEWFENGLAIIISLQQAMHGEINIRELDESYVRNWQMFGLEMEYAVVQDGATPINRWLEEERKAGRTGREIPGMIPPPE